ncbi:MAG: DUF4080 domain-containing protein [Lachnospiraceae bacterium]|nr:DUF4080 domain-containing protein [Lachnospiraceae bacterium]
MKVVLAAINAKYIHSNLAVYCLYSYSKEEFGQDIEIVQYTINQQIDYIIKDLYMKKPDVVAFSCYIWNRDYIEKIVRELHKVLPDTLIWAGGPEASYDAVNMMNSVKELQGIMIGEGEVTFNNLLHMWKYGQGSFKDIKGIVYRSNSGNNAGNPTIEVNPPAEPINLSDVPFPYENTDDFKNRIIYYESSRGCPFSCSYCLSSIDKKLRFRDIELVKKELKFFMDNRVKQVKFVDRTFNCSKNHAMEIWRFINDNDNGVTNFHFEISADLLDDEQIELFKGFRPGLVQFEIGVQSVNAQTIKEIHRHMNLERLYEVVKRMQSYGNIHQHLDLIAGLPYEDYDSFKKSFNDVYNMRPDQLQLGFLKVLNGSYMHEKHKDYGMVYHSEPPYEILYNHWISYDDVLKLKTVEEMVEVYYNSGQFKYTMEYMLRYFNSPFEMYEILGKYYEDNGLFGEKQSRLKRYEILYDFAGHRNNINSDELKALLMYDLYLRENLKSRPAFSREQPASPDMLKEINRKYRGLGKNIHVESFEYNPVELALYGSSEKGMYFIRFDYTKRGALDNNALAQFV